MVGLDRLSNSSDCPVVPLWIPSLQGVNFVLIQAELGMKHLKKKSKAKEKIYGFTERACWGLVCPKRVQERGWVALNQGAAKRSSYQTSASCFRSAVLMWLFLNITLGLWTYFWFYSKCLHTDIQSYKITWLIPCENVVSFKRVKYLLYHLFIFSLVR